MLLPSASVCEGRYTSLAAAHLQMRQPGAITSIAGGNDAGKSQLLRAIATVAKQSDAMPMPMTMPMTMTMTMTMTMLTAVRPTAVSPDDSPERPHLRVRSPR